MASKTVVTVAGATGANGRSIVQGLLDLDLNTVRVLTTRSLDVLSKDSIFKSWADSGVEFHPVDYQDAETLKAAIQGSATVISALGVETQNLLRSQKPLIDVAKACGAERFVPSDWSIFLPEEGVMKLSDEKHDIHRYIESSGIGYTYIDIGNWHTFALYDLGIGIQAPPYYVKDRAMVVGYGLALNAMTHIDDVGKLAARVVNDPRTLNQYVCFAGAGFQTILGSITLWEEITGRHLERWVISEEAVEFAVQALKRALGPSGVKGSDMVFEQGILEYIFAKQVVRCNAAIPEGALDGRVLYPDLRTKSWRDCLEEIAAGSVVIPERTRQLATENASL